MTNRQAHEEAAGMSLDDSFFSLNSIDPNADYFEITTDEFAEIEEEANKLDVLIPNITELLNRDNNKFYQVVSKTRNGYLAYEDNSNDKPIVAFGDEERAVIFCTFYNTFFDTDFYPLLTIQRVGKRPDTTFNKNLSFVWVETARLG